MRDDRGCALLPQPADHQPRSLLREAAMLLCGADHPRDLSRKPVSLPGHSRLDEPDSVGVVVAGRATQFSQHSRPSSE